METTYTARLSIGYNVNGKPFWNTPIVREYIAQYLRRDYSCYEMYGSWDGVPETSLHVELYALSERDLSDLYHFQVPQLAAALRQECIAFNYAPEYTEFIRAATDAA